MIDVVRQQVPVKNIASAVDGPLPVPRDLLCAGIELDADIEIERQHRIEALKAELGAMAAQGNFAHAIDKMMDIVLGLEQENERMSSRLLRALRYRFGRNTENLAPAELKQLYLALGGDAAAPTPAEGLLVPVPVAPTEVLSADGKVTTPSGADKKRRQRKIGGATVVDANIERNITKVPVPAEERICALCGGDKTIFATVEHQRIEFVPAKVVVLHIEQREKMTCLACRKDVSIAPRTQAPAAIRKVGSSFLAKLLADKCTLGLPLDRQRREFDRMGLHMPDKTLASYWAYSTDILSPVASSVTGNVFASNIVGADDSHLKTLDRTAKNGVFRAHLWCFVGTDGTDGTVGGREMVAYGYTQSWNAEDIADWFSSIDGGSNVTATPDTRPRSKTTTGRRWSPSPTIAASAVVCTFDPSSTPHCWQKTNVQPFRSNSLPTSTSLRLSARPTVSMPRHGAGSAARAPCPFWISWTPG